jgi:hypothetical protein
MATPAKRQRQSASLTLEQAISLLQEAGFTIEAPPLEALATKRSDAPAALGFTDAALHTHPAKPHNISTITLTFAHSVNGRIFGPGKVQVKSPALLHHLLSQDTRAIAQEHAVFDPTQRSYLIVQRKTPAGVIGPAAVPLQGFELTQMDNVPAYGEYSRGDT